MILLLIKLSIHLYLSPWRSPIHAMNNPVKPGLKLLIRRSGQLGFNLFVCGLHNELIQTRLLSEPSLSLAKATEITSAMEAAAKDTLELQGRTSLK